MKARQKLSYKITAMIIVMIAICSSCALMFVYMEVQRDFYRLKGSSAKSQASSLASSLDPKEIELLDLTGEVNYYYYSYIKKVLGEFGIHSNSKYLFVMTMADNKTHFKIIYAQSAIETQIGSQAVYRELGELVPIENFNESALRSYVSGTTVSSHPFYSETFGDLIAGYSPIMGDDGVVAIVGVYTTLDDVHGYLDRIQQITFFTVTMSIAFVGIIAFAYIDHSLRVPIEALSRMSDGVVNGDLNIDAKIRSRDEIGFLYANFKTMQSTIKELLAAIHDVSEAQKAGDIQSAIVVDQFSGAYRDVAISVNDLLIDMHDDVLDILSSFISVSGGDFSTHLALRPGSKIIANEAFDSVKRSLKSVYSGLNVLVKSTVESELATDGQVSQYSGDWGPLMKRVANFHLEAEKQRQIIVEGLGYASVVQRSLLPDKKLFEAVFKDYSVIWEPRDVVGGDIYWIKNFDEGTLLCVCDCTGHGTSGALLTMLFVSALESIVNESNYKDTAEVLWGVEQKFVSVFGVDPGTNERGKTLQVQNGCDLAVIYIPKEGEVNISSGFLNVFICNGSEVRRIKGQRIFVGDGKLKSKEDVKVISLPASSGDKFYVASDGLFDQVGGEPPRPFGYNRFSEIILTHHKEELSVITDKIWAKYEDYRGEQQRRDDFELITFML